MPTWNNSRNWSRRAMKVRKTCMNPWVEGKTWVSARAQIPSRLHALGWLPSSASRIIECHFLSRKEHRIFVLRNYGNEESHPFPMEMGSLIALIHTQRRILAVFLFFNSQNAGSQDFIPDTDDRIASRIIDNFRGNN